MESGLQSLLPKFDRSLYMASIRFDAEVYHCFAELHRSLPSEPSESGAVCFVRLQKSSAEVNYPRFRFHVQFFTHFHHFVCKIYCTSFSCASFSFQTGGNLAAGIQLNTFAATLKCFGATKTMHVCKNPQCNLWFLRDGSWVGWGGCDNVPINYNAHVHYNTTVKQRGFLCTCSLKALCFYVTGMCL